MMPDPNPTLVSIRTTEGPTSWTSLTNSDCSLNDDDDVLAAGLAAVVPQAASTTASTAAATNPMVRLDTLLTLDISSSRASLDVSSTACFCNALGPILRAHGYQQTAHRRHREPLPNGVG